MTSAWYQDRPLPDQIRDKAWPLISACLPDNLRPNCAISIDMGEVSPGSDALIHTVRIAWAEDLSYADVRGIANAMDVITTNEKMPQGWGFELGGQYWVIGDGDDSLAARLTGGVLHIWVRSWRDENPFNDD